MTNILTLENVNKKYEKSNFSIRNISFSLPEGSILGFIGENGSGKSTTMNCILNVLRKDSGKIGIFGKEMSDEDTDIRENIGVVYDSNNFPEHLTAEQLADIFEKIYSKWDNAYYKLASNLRVLLIFIFLVGISILIFGGRNEMPLISFLCLTVIGFPFISSIGLRKNSSGKWNQYILSLPVKRCEIIKSVFMTQFITILIGSILSMGLFLTSFALHGFAFYRYVDVLLIFSFFIGVIFIMNAIFLPISYLDFNDRTEAMSIISLIVSVAIMVGLIAVINTLFEKPSDTQLISFGIACLLLSSVTFILSYFLTVRIYLKQDC